MNIKRTLTTCIFAALILIGTERIYFTLTKGFRLGKISSEHQPNPDWQAPPLCCLDQKEVNLALDQPYYFLGRGVQCYAFKSLDGNYVIKLFKQYRMPPEHYLKRINLVIPQLEKWRKNKLERIEHRRPKTYRSYLLAGSTLREETGTLFCHLNKSEGLNKTVTLIDAVGIRHEIELDKTEFLIQRMSTLAHVEINTLMREGRYDDAKERIDALIDLFVDQMRKGVHDNDINFKKNYGFIEGKPIKLDIGSFRENCWYETQERFESELRHQTRRMAIWIDDVQPSLRPHFDAAIDRAVENFTPSKTHL